MAVVTIPFDYEESNDSKSVVPICVEDTDSQGRKIARGWINAIVPVADGIRGLARWRLEDEWRASELADLTVHRVWYKHLDDLGLSPTGRIWENAKWAVEDLRFGDRRARCGREGSLPDDETALAGKLRAADPKALARLLPHHDYDFAREVERTLLFDAIARQIKLRGNVQADEMLDMIRHGMDRKEISAVFGKKPNTVTQIVYRAIRRAFNDLGML